MREFEEETDLSSDEYILLENVSPISEEYTGSNGVRYKHIYYYAIYKGSKDNQVINPDKYEQYTEIGDIKWLTIDECYSKIREDMKELLLQRIISRKNRVAATDEFVMKDRDYTKEDGIMIGVW